MSLENLIGVLRLHNVELTSELLVMLGKLFVRYDALDVLVFGLVGISLPAKHEGHLRLDCAVVAFGHNLVNELHVIHLLGNSQCVRVPPETLVDVKSSAEDQHHFLSVRRVRATRQEVGAHSIEVVLIAEGAQFLQAFALNHQVDRFSLLVVVDELGDNLIDQTLDVLHGLLFLHAHLVLGANLARKAAQILVAPTNEVLSAAQEAVFQSVRLIVFARDHAHDRAELSKLTLQFLVNPRTTIFLTKTYLEVASWRRLVTLDDVFVQHTKELEGLGHGGHA